MTRAERDRVYLLFIECTTATLARAYGLHAAWVWRMIGQGLAARGAERH